MSAFEKIGAYDLIVVLIPGLVLTETLRATGVPFTGADKIASYGVLALLLGAISSRAGSFIATPIAKRILRQKNSYSDYVDAEKIDEKIQRVSQTSNFYRSLVGVGITYVIILLAYWLSEYFGISRPYRIHLSVFLLTILFFISYLKQESFVSKRVKANKSG